MNSTLRILPLAARFAMGLAAILSTHAVRADDGNVRVDVVVDMTEEGEKLLPSESRQFPHLLSSVHGRVH